MTESLSCVTCGRPLPKDAPSGQCPPCLLALAMSPPPEISSGEQRGLLFALFALRLGLLDAAALRRHSEVPGGPDAPKVAAVMAEQKVLHRADRQLADELVSLTTDHFDGDEALAFESLGGWPALQRLWAHYDADPQADRSGVVSESAEALPTLKSLRYSTVRELPGRYTGPREQSRGGMGRVFFVQDEYLDREVALKELIPLDEMAPAAALDDHSGSVAAQMVSRFLREARLTGRLEHPSIVPVYELGRRSNGSLYYTMKLVRGRTLEQALQGAATLKDRLELLPHFLDLCQAVGYAHSKNVIHRDIKPSNVMIGEFGETVIIDWGLAKVVGGDEQSGSSTSESAEENTPAATMVGTRLGTPRYMSPEQASGFTDEVDQRSDVFALGIVLYELLTGQVPLDGEVTEEIFHQIHNEKPVPVFQIERGAPPELAVICSHAMRKNPKDRYQNAKDLADEIQRFMTGATVRSYIYSPGELLGRFYVQHRTLMNAAAATAVAALVLGSFSYWNIGTARDEAVSAKIDALEALDSATIARRQAETSRAVMEHALAQADTDRRSAESAQYVNGIALARISIDEGKLVKARENLDKLPTAYRKWEWNYLAALAWPRTNVGPGETPDSGADEQSAVDAWDGAHANSVLTISAHEAEVTGVDFSADGRRLATKSIDGTARIWDAATGTMLAAIEGSDGNYGPALFLDGDRHVARSKGASGVSVCDAQTGREVAVLEGHTEAAIP
ncbi:MAG: WD40 repeat domain-containing serine/threonine-protein kinase, partial [Candidatus Hydrogenedentota bacterium]